MLKEEIDLKILMIYSSIHHSNTEKIVKVIGETINASIVEAKDFKMNTLENYDVIGFGSGIYAGKFHKNVLDLIDKLPKLNNKKAFVFSTSGTGVLKYNIKVEEELKKYGFEIIGSFACKGYDTYGPLKLFGGIGKGRPNEEDFQNAKDFAKKLPINYVSA
jgi:flavodoxin